MSLFVVYGILLIAVGAFISGSFAIPFDKVKKWEWENYLLVRYDACLVYLPVGQKENEFFSI